MKLGTIEVAARGVKAGTITQPRVVLVLKAGWFANDFDITPHQAREMAAELLQAANVAEGKA